MRLPFGLDLISLMVGIAVALWGFPALRSLLAR
jgi:hypothetical protein